ncbi:MAG: hypothetical protein ACO2O6_06255 [Candidatus Hydrothermia bacterium]|jgi:hypothetical protein
MRIKIFDRKAKKGKIKKDKKLQELLSKSKIIIKSYDKVNLGTFTIEAQSNQIGNIKLIKQSPNEFVITYSDTTKPIKSIEDLLDFGVVLYNLDEVYLESKEFDKYILITAGGIFFIILISFLLGFLIGKSRL